MEAFGRMISVLFAGVSVVFALVYYRTSSVWWQKEETVRSMTHTYVEELMKGKTVSEKEWRLFREQLSRFGNYRAELIVFERRRFEGKDGRVYLYTEWRPEKGEKPLTEGSYVRVTVTEDEKKPITVFFGAGSTIFAGGRIS